LWKRNTKDIAEEFIALGFRSVITCVDTRVLDRSLVGKNFDSEFLANFPKDKNADLCGENGEFHSFAYAGPIFRYAIEYQFPIISYGPN
jgi:diphthamide synthase (EF-2-diphthine--ammonia ligase)